jgi:hypothetical protein
LLLRDGVNVPIRQEKIGIFSAHHAHDKKSSQQENQSPFSCRVHIPTECCGNEGDTVPLENQCRASRLDAPPNF